MGNESCHVGSNEMSGLKVKADLPLAELARELLRAITNVPMKRAIATGWKGYSVNLAATACPQAACGGSNRNNRLVD
jgi:hypothetical protein